jgi:hypothetical protein
MKCNSPALPIARYFFFALALAAMLMSTNPVFARQATLLKFNGSDGAFSTAGLITDGTNFYGTTSENPPNFNGLVFELSPPASGSGAWTETVLYTFTGGKDGSGPSAGLVRDAKGNLYGTATYGGPGNAACGSGCGTVFELSPPSQPGGTWTETTIYQFKASLDGANPESGLILDQAGNLYGTTMLGGSSQECCGTAFELSPPQQPDGSWTETVLHDFKGGTDGEILWAGLYRDAAGNLYGTTLNGGANNDGIAFQLVPPSSGGTWTENILVEFSGVFSGGTYGPLVEYKGSLYGAGYASGSSGQGSVFSLTPAAGTWTYSTLYSFTGGSDGGTPNGLVVDSQGNLYGGTEAGGDLNDGTCHLSFFRVVGCGVVYKLTPQNGGQAWTQSVLATLQASEGFGIYAPLLMSKGVLWGTTQQGGANPNRCQLGCGTVFAVKP